MNSKTRKKKEREKRIDKNRKNHLEKKSHFFKKKHTNNNYPGASSPQICFPAIVEPYFGGSFSSVREEFAYLFKFNISFLFFLKKQIRKCNIFLKKKKNIFTEILFLLLLSHHSDNTKLSQNDCLQPQNMDWKHNVQNNHDEHSNECVVCNEPKEFRFFF